MAKVRFYDIGDFKKGWTEEIADPSEDNLKHALALRAQVLESGVRCIEGRVLASGWLRGRYEILPEGGAQ